jgi:hypothetical protein
LPMRGAVIGVGGELAGEGGRVGTSARLPGR